MRIERLVYVMVLATCTATISLSAQEKPAPSAGNSSPAIVLPRELELEEQLQIARDERDGAINRVEQLQLEKQQLAAVIERMVSDALAEVQRPRVEKAAEGREAVARKLVAAMKGDWEKRDRWDWQRRGLVRSDGTFVPLVPPDAAKEKK